MAKRKVTKASRRRLVFFGTISIVVVIYFLVNVSYYAVEIYNLKKDEKKLEQHLIDLQSNEKNLKVQIEMLKDDEYLAKYARENYLYSKDGEIVLKLSNKDDEKEEDNSALAWNSNYIIYGGVGMIGILILYVVSKKVK